MVRVAGVKIEKDAKGNPRYARFDLRKHGEVIEPYLNSIGAIDDYDLLDCIPIDKAFDNIIEKIKTWDEKK